MAKPIKETPVLYDEDAYRFEMAKDAQGSGLGRG